MKPSDVNKVDPKYTSLDDYKTALAFLKIPDIKIFDDETNKQRYIWGYDIYIYMTRSIIPVLLVIISYFIVIFIENKYPSYFKNNSVLSCMWPWNASVSERLSAIRRGEEANIVTSLTGVVSTIWLFWMLVRVFVELKLQGSFFILRMSFIVAMAAILMWLTASVAFYEAPSFGPTIDDPTLILCLKKLVLISFSYWLSGYFILVTAPYLRSVLKIVIKNSKRNTS